MNIILSSRCLIVKALPINSSFWDTVNGFDIAVWLTVARKAYIVMNPYEFRRVRQPLPSKKHYRLLKRTPSYGVLVVDMLLPRLTSPLQIGYNDARTCLATLQGWSTIITMKHISNFQVTLKNRLKNRYKINCCIRKQIGVKLIGYHSTNSLMY